MRNYRTGEITAMFTLPNGLERFLEEVNLYPDEWTRREIIYRIREYEEQVKDILEVEEFIGERDDSTKDDLRRAVQILRAALIRHHGGDIQAGEEGIFLEPIEINWEQIDPIFRSQP